MAGAPTPTNADDATVRQEDREAAADAVKAYRDRKNGDWQQRIRDGKCDDGAMVQAFAKHRIAHQSTGEVERLRQALAEIRDIEWVHEGRTVPIVMDQNLRKAREIATTALRTPPAPAGDIDAFTGCADDRGLFAQPDMDEPAPAGEERAKPIEDAIGRLGNLQLMNAVGEVLRQAYYLLDDTANDNPPEVPQESWDNLSNAVTALEALIPDSEQPCMIGVAARLLRTTGFIAGRDAAAGVADDNRTDDDSMWDRAAVAIAQGIRAIEAPGEAGRAATTLDPHGAALTPDAQVTEG
jgi:hypothetical protein